MSRLRVTELTWPGLAIAAMAWAALLLMREQPLAPLWPALAFLPALIWPRQTLLWLLIGVLGMWMAWTYEQAWAQRVMGPAQELLVPGHIVGQPEQRDGNAYFAFAPEAEAPGLLRVAWYRDAPQLQAGDCWILTLRVRAPHGNANPGGLDYEAWLFREAYAGKASVREGKLCGRRAPDWRQRWVSELDALQRPRASATLRALMLGDRRDIADADWEILRRTGTSHLFAISGLHLGLIAALGWALGLALWKLVGVHVWPRGREWGALGAVMLALLYAWVSGFGLPVQRALIMCVFAALAMLGGRQRQALHVLALAFVVVVAINPLSVLMPGLWLSFTAAAGIIAYLHYRADQSWLRQLFGIQVLLAFLLLPLSAWFFGGVSLLGASVNLLLVPLFSVLLPLLLLSSVTQLVSGWDRPLDWALQLLDLMWAALETAASWPAAYANLAQPALWSVVLATLGVMLWTRPRRGGQMLGVALALPLLALQPARPAPGDVRIWVWDVGQGQSVLVQTAGHDLVYDAGPAWGRFNAAQRLVLPALQALDVDQLDALMISHPDSDHAGGADALIEALRPRRVWSASHTRCQAGQRWQWDEVVFTILHPPSGPASDNNRSCVLLLRTASGRQILLPGDIEAAAEQVILDAHPDLRADVVLMPHHGSRSSSTERFVQQLAPQLALASAGWQNRWGFPDDVVRQRYRNSSAEILVSGDAGALRIDVGEDVEAAGWRALRPRLWRDFSALSAP